MEIKNVLNEDKREKVARYEHEDNENRVLIELPRRLGGFYIYKYIFTHTHRYINMSKLVINMILYN